MRSEKEAGACFEECLWPDEHPGSQCDACARREAREAFLGRAEMLEMKIRSLKGISVQCHEARTGTIYLTVDHENFSEGPLTIRVADHHDVYATSDYTADGLEGTDEGAVGFIEKKIAIFTSR